MRRRYEHRVIGILNRLSGVDRVHAEYAVPRASRSIDALLLLDEAPDGFGSLRPHVAFRATVLEHFSRSVSPERFNGPLVKVGVIVEEHWRQPPAERRARQPVLLLIAQHRPVRLVQALPSVRVLEPGLWSWERPWFGDALILVPGELEDRPGNAALKLMMMPRNAAEAAAGLARLQADPLLLDSLKANLLEDLMTGTIPPTTDERERIIDRIRREGREEGRREALEERDRIRREGREEGLEQGRRALLVEMLQSRFGDLPAEALHRIETASTSEIDRWAKCVLGAASLAELLDETPR